MAELQRIRAMKIAEELGDEYIEMLKENFDANLPKVLREYVCRNVYIADERAMQVFEEALEVARGIENESWKERALRSIAVELAKINLDKGLQVAKEIKYEWNKAWALRFIVGKVAMVDPNKALGVAREIENAVEKARALGEISAELAKVNSEKAMLVFDEALKVAMEIEDAEKKAWALRDIAVELAKVNIEKALEVAMEIEDTGWKASALESIAGDTEKENYFKHNRVFEEAVAEAEIKGIFIAESDTKGDRRYDSYTALKNIVVKLAKVKPEKALEVARGIDDEYWKARAMASIASALCLQKTSNAMKNVPDELILDAYKSAPDEFLKKMKEILVEKRADEISKEETPRSQMPEELLKKLERMSNRNLIDLITENGKISGEKIAKNWDKIERILAEEMEEILALREALKKRGAEEK